MTKLRKAAATLAATAALIGGTALGTQTAGADSGPGAAPVKRVAPAAPVAAQAGPLATSPYTSPASSAGHVAPGQSYTCEGGNLCSLAWDPTVNKWELFKMYTCNRYYLYYWNGTGSYLNNQTSGSRGAFYDQNGNVLKYIYRDTTQRSYDWSPVYSIRNCGA